MLGDIVSWCWATNTPYSYKDLLGGPFHTDPHKVFGGFWKGYRLETTLRILRVRKDGNRLTVYLYHFLRWYVRDFNHPRYPSNKLKQIQENDFKLPSLICQIIQRIHFWRILTAPPPPTQNWHFHFCGIWAGCVFSSPKTCFFPAPGSWLNHNAHVGPPPSFSRFHWALEIKATDIFTDFSNFVDVCWRWVNGSNVFVSKKKSVARFAMFINIGYGKAGAPWRESQ